ncbi:addiction module protein [Methylophilus sp. 5]|uniref:addiction module protein n=1 Tax=Methylophilus sp. 5 TaxID=1112274 RepID=UPI0004900718|nr:addiction module protein [Methylophilus sp. 5]
MKTSDIISELANLPVDERVLIADSLLQTLNATQPEIEQAWLKLAQQRLTEISDGSVETLSAEVVFADIDKRLGA